MQHAITYAKDPMGFETGVIWVINHRHDIMKWYNRLGFQESGRDVPFDVPGNDALNENTRFLIFTQKL